MGFSSYFCGVRALYDSRTGAVGVRADRERHTALMAWHAGATAFVTEAGGFIGTELIKSLVARGHHVIGLVGSTQAAQRVRRAGATAVMGDLLVPGQWQDEAAADWVFHLAAHR